MPLQDFSLAAFLGREMPYLKIVLSIRWVAASQAAGRQAGGAGQRLGSLAGMSDRVHVAAPTQGAHLPRDQLLRAPGER